MTEQEEAAFDRWWKQTMQNRMSHSRYLARKAWAAALTYGRRTRQVVEVPKSSPGSSGKTPESLVIRIK